MAEEKLQKLQNLVALFDKPLEPLFKVKDNKQFILPDEYVPDNHKNSVEKVKKQLRTRSGAENITKVRVEKASTLPNLKEISESLKKNDCFSLFMPKHQEMAAKLAEIFLNAEDLLSVACYAYERVNKHLFFYAYTVALLHREDTKGAKVPNQIQQFPDLFFDKEVFTKAREELKLESQSDRVPIELNRDYTACDLEMEHRMAYFREDLAVNLHHWHWHLAYPGRGCNQIIKKDRRGELFYYMHQQIIARYNFDRICNHLKRVERLSNWNAPIEEAYFPKLSSTVASRGYPSRPKNMSLNDIDVPRDNFEMDISDLIRWRDRIYKAIDLGFAKGMYDRSVPLDEVNGIDILGNMIESTDLSPNREYYGDLHGAGHMMVSYIHDPKNYHDESLGVMGDVATAMRDPVFYRWHSYVDSLFHRFQARLKPYAENKLNYPGVTVTGASVQTEGEEAKNILRTHWQKSTTELRGLDIIQSDEDEEKPKILVRYTHLQHEEFNYEITVKNDTDAVKEGTCRIFISPAVDESGKAWYYKQQRFMFVEMDRFKVTLQPGENTITRKSVDSTVTIPFERTFYDFEGSLTDAAALEKQMFGYCGCGWPHHLLVPKGTPNGFDTQLFVMISNYEDDKVEQNEECKCRVGESGESFCGVRGGKYPDKRAMGFPFDRLAEDGVVYLDEFMAPYTNMLVEKFQIVHTNKEKIN